MQYQQKISYHQMSRQAQQHFSAINVLVGKTNCEIDLRQVDDKFVKQLYQISLLRNYTVLDPMDKESKDYVKSQDIINITYLQAFNLIWRKISQDVGIQVNSNDDKSLQILSELQFQLKMLHQPQKLFQKLQISHKKPIIQTQQIKQLCKEIEDLKKDIIQDYKTNIIPKIIEKSQRYRQNKYMMANYLEHIILKIQRDIFIKSIIAIKTDETQQVQLIFEAAYPTRILTKLQAIQILGQQFYMNKSNAYFEYYSQYFLEDKQNIMIYCHYCLQPTPIQYNLCQNNDAYDQIQSSLLTDPYLYHTKMYKKNFIQQELKQTKKYIHPYLKYYQAINCNKYMCNRIFCDKCQLFSLFLSHKNFSCSYCHGSCNCKRCSQMDQLVKLMGIYIEFGGNLDKLTQKFLFNLQPHQKTKNNHPLATDPIQSYTIQQMINSFKQQKIFTLYQQAKKKIDPQYYFPIDFEPLKFQPKKYSPPIRMSLPISEFDLRLKKQQQSYNKRKKIEQKRRIKLQQAALSSKKDTNYKDGENFGSNQSDINLSIVEENKSKTSQFEKLKGSIFEEDE